jgi:plasmid stabilization system protein ParE
MKIIWTEKAVIENQKNIYYLIENWDQNVLISYLNKLDSLIDLLSTNPNLGQWDKEIESNKRFASQSFLKHYVSIISRYVK